MGKTIDMDLTLEVYGPAISEDENNVVKLASFKADSDNRRSIVATGNMCEQLAMALNSSIVAIMLHRLFNLFIGTDVMLPANVFSYAVQRVPRVDRVYLTFRAVSRKGTSYVSVKGRKPSTYNGYSAQVVGEWVSDTGKLRGYRVVFDDTIALDLAVDGHKHFIPKLWTVQTLWGFIKHDVHVGACAQAQAMTAVFSRGKKPSQRNIYHRVRYVMLKKDSGEAL